MKPLCLKKHQLKALNFIIVLILLTMPPNDCFGQCLDLVITEVGIVPLGGGKAQESREFIELYNPTASPIDVAGYWLRTDLNNNITNPIFADVEIVDWTTRRPNNIPNDLVVGPLTLNSTIIPAGGYAVIVSPRAHVYTDLVAPFYDLADNTVCLTPANFLYWGGSNVGPLAPNNWLNNDEDFVAIYDGDPSLLGSTLIDSLGWKGTEPDGGWSIQMDDDCVFRWPSGSTSPTAAGFTGDADGSILLSLSPGSANTVVFGLCCAIISNDTSICQGDSILLTAAGSTTGYNWVDSLTFTPILATDSFYMASPITTTTYAMYNTTDTSYVTVTVLPIQSTNLSDTLCQGDSIQLPGGSYASTAGVFNDTLSTVPGCDSVIITTVSIIPATSSSVSAVICPGDSLFVEAAWQTLAGTYFDTVPNAMGCDSTITTTLIVDSAYLTSSPVAICQGDSLQLPGGAYTGIAGIFTDSFSTVTGCDSVFITTLTVDTAFDAAITPVNAICANTGILMLTAADGGGAWSGSGITNADSGYFDPSLAGAGTHEIIYTIGGSCGDSDTINISVYEVPSLSLLALDESCEGENDGSVELTVTGGATPYTYLWNDIGSSTTQNLTALNPGGYTVIVTDSNSCEVTDNIVILASSTKCFTPYVYVPNVFSPNGDGENDKLFVQGKGIEQLTFVIYDRWGEKVFETNDQGTGWDGTYKGKAMNEAVFVYYLKAAFNDESIVEKKGNLTLVR